MNRTVYVTSVHNWFKANCGPKNIRTAKLNDFGATWEIPHGPRFVLSFSKKDAMISVSLPAQLKQHRFVFPTAILIPQALDYFADNGVPPDIPLKWCQEHLMTT